MCKFQTGKSVSAIIHTGTYTVSTNGCKINSGLIQGSELQTNLNIHVAIFIRFYIQICKNKGF